MKTRSIWWIGQAAVLVAAVSISAVGKPQTENGFSGTIDDFTPAASAPAGPWHVGGDWTLRLNGQSGTADFNANFTMVRSDYWVLIQSSPGVTANDPSTRSPHTHHVSLTDGDVTPIAGGFEVKGTATLTASGGVPPFGSDVPITIDIIGGTIDTYSNIKISFGGMAAMHFGPQPIEGVVKN